MKRLKSELLRLDFPYDWANKDISDDALVYNVLKKTRFMDILRIYAFYGGEKISAIAETIEDATKAKLGRILSTIRAAGQDA